MLVDGARADASNRAIRLVARPPATWSITWASLGGQADGGHPLAALPAPARRPGRGRGRARKDRLDRPLRPLGAPGDLRVAVRLGDLRAEQVAEQPSIPELLWGLRGAGANFGVVTQLEFALHRVNPMAKIGLLFWGASEARRALQFARDYMSVLPEGTNALLAGMTAPAAPFVPAEYHGVDGFAVVVVSWGSQEDHAAALQPLRELSPQFEMVSPIPCVEL